MKKYTSLLISILIAQAAGIIGSLPTTGSVSTWYTTLNLPSWNPPNVIFGPVWITLYTLIGISAWLIWRKRQDVPRVRRLLIVYGVHLVLNSLWSILFFGLNVLAIAFAEILLLLAVIVYLIVAFWSIDRRASLLLLPYAAWVAFASFLNFTIYRLN